MSRKNKVAEGQLSLFENFSKPTKKVRSKRKPARQELYLKTYHPLRDYVIEISDVGGACLTNRIISETAVADSNRRRKENPHWRDYCSDLEKDKIIIGQITTFHEMLRNPHRTLKQNIHDAAQKACAMYRILDEPVQVS